MCQAVFGYYRIIYRIYTYQLHIWSVQSSHTTDKRECSEIVEQSQSGTLCCSFWLPFRRLIIFFSTRHSWAGPDWLIQSTWKILGRPVWFLSHEGQCSVLALVEIYHRFCTCSPRAECSPVDDLITVWLQPMASHCPVVHLESVVLTVRCRK